MANRVGGPIELKVGGEIQDAKGEFTYNPGRPKRDAVVGNDAVHGFKEVPQVAFVEGVITDRGNLDLVALVTGNNLTITVGLPNGKTFFLRDAWWAGEGTVNTGEGEIAVRWEGRSGEEV